MSKALRGFVAHLGKPKILSCGSQLCAVVAGFDRRRPELVWLKAGVKRRSVRTVGQVLAELCEFADSILQV